MFKTLLGTTAALLALGVCTAPPANAEPVVGPVANLPEVRVVLAGDVVRVRLSGCKPGERYRLQRLTKSGTWKNRGKKRCSKRHSIRIDKAVSERAKEFRLRRKGTTVASFVVYSPAAEPGPQGEQGPQGPQGATGPQGPQGTAGSDLLAEKWLRCKLAGGSGYPAVLMPNAIAELNLDVNQIALAFAAIDGIEAAADYVNSYAEPDRDLALYLGLPIGCALGDEDYMRALIDHHYLGRA